MEEAETKIRETVKDDWLYRRSKSETDKKIRKIISEALRQITIPDLADAGRRSLLNFYYRQYQEMSRLNGQKLLVLLAVLKLTDKDNKYVKNMSLSRANDILSQNSIRIMQDYGYDTTKLYGVPMQKFSKDYFEKDVKPVFDRLVKQYPFDPDSVPKDKDVARAKNKHINSLRNRAEMEVRYDGHLENIRTLKEQGHRLVIAPTHADCSDRCAKWQGRVYSLDGTYGTTPDGRKYIPLEKATDIWYTTKAGKRYKNGLLGFNCRHYLVPYKDGYHFPKPNAEEEHKEYLITQTQRRLERNVREWRNEALMYKDTYKQAAQIARNSAIEANEIYIKFSKENGRAYYPSRTKIL